MTTEESYIELKKVYIDSVKGDLIEAGHIEPMVSIFAVEKGKKKSKETKNSILHIPIPREFMQNDKGKDKFLNIVLPQIYSEIEKTWTPIAVAWSAEAWMRKVDLTKDPAPTTTEEMQDIPVTAEVLILTIESKDKQECEFYEIIHEDMSVLENGEFSEGTLRLELMNDLPDSEGKFSGRFTGLFKKLTKNG